MILSYRHQGKDVYTDCIIRGEHVLFLDRSHDHGGWSITNSVEGAIEAYVEKFGDKWTFYEAYEYDLERSLTKVELTRSGVPHWSPPTPEERLIWE